MTLDEVHRCVNKHTKRISRQALHYHLRALGIKRRGVARPALYPDDTANRVIIRLYGSLTNGHSKAKGRR
jgi:hypothetical protein